MAKHQWYRSSMAAKISGIEMINGVKKQPNKAMWHRWRMAIASKWQRNVWRGAKASSVMA